MVNGRISAKSFRGYTAISGFMKTVLNYGTLFLMQTEGDAERMRLLGVDEKKVIVAGSFKFDSPDRQTIPLWAARLQGPLQGPIIVAGSTHAGEEALMISAFRGNLEQVPALKLVLAPRHPERFSEVETLVRESGLPFIRRTQLRETTEEDTIDICRDIRIIILDSIGELSSVYGISDIAVIGKSFLEQGGQGGQNPLEPARWGKAILCGPHMENFPFIRDFYQEGAAFEVSAEGLAGKIRELLAEPSLAREAGERARQIYARNSGAVERTVGRIVQYIR
jgi:3-deoxy-D-manno-octulosonic-acid transferase